MYSLEKPIPLTISPLDPAWFRRAEDYQARLTMPTGALGRLLDLGRQLCAVQQTLKPLAEPGVVVVAAADHGVTVEGVSAYPSEVTGQMVANFLRGGAAVNVLARRAGARVVVVDMGVRDLSAARPLLPHPDFVGDCAIAPGTANFLHGPAMTSDQAERAVAAGRRVVVEHLLPHGVRVVALGEMGIGNTTSASALTAVLTGLPVEAVTGRGTGIDDATLRHKVAVIERALARHFPQRAPGSPVDPLAALGAVGGFEIAGLAGVALEAAANRTLVVLDGLISTVAGLLAARMEPAARDYFVASHQGVEVGHRALLRELGLVPLFDLGLRLGEGSGAVLALPLLASAADLFHGMATFASAGVRDRG